MAVTLTYDPALSRVRITADGLGASPSALVQRSTDGGITWTTVRGADEATVSAGGLVPPVDDYEFVDGVEHTYRVTPHPITEGFEDSTLDVDVTGTWTRSQTAAHTGSWSYRAATIGDAATSDAVVTVPAGATTLDFAYKVSSEQDFDFFVLLIDAVEELTDTGEVDWTVTSGHDVSTATTVTFRYEKDATFFDGQDTAWIDDLIFGFTAQTNTITPSLNGQIWLKFPARPYLNRPITVLDFSDVERPDRGGLFDVIGRTLPIAITDVGGSRRYTLTASTTTPAKAAELDLMLASGDLLYLHTPAGCPVPGGYWKAGTVAVSRRTVRGLRRYFDIPLAEIAAPGPDVVGSTGTCATVLATYATCADVLAAHPTCADLLELIGDPTEVIVG